MKGLPYFQFHPEEWMAGDISDEALETQGLFINVCALYWARECCIKFDKIKRRFSNAQAMLESLLEECLIKVDEDGYLEIGFLKEQYEDLLEKKQKRVDAGRKGGQSTRSKIIDKKQSLSSDESKSSDTAQANRKQCLSNAQALRTEQNRTDHNNTEHIPPSVEGDARGSESGTDQENSQAPSTDQDHISQPEIKPKPQPPKKPKANYTPEFDYYWPEIKNLNPDYNRKGACFKVWGKARSANCEPEEIMNFYRHLCTIKPFAFFEKNIDPMSIKDFVENPVAKSKYQESLDVIWQNMEEQGFVKADNLNRKDFDNVTEPCLRAGLTDNEIFCGWENYLHAYGLYEYRKHYKNWMCTENVKQFNAYSDYELDAMKKQYSSEEF